MDQRLPTFGQLERELSQKIHKLYREELDYSPKKVTCKFFSDKLAIVVEDALTMVEKSLIKNGDRKTTKELNSAINNILQLKLKILIEEVLSVKVENILLDSNFTTQTTGAIYTLSQLPLVRAARPIAKSKQPESKKAGAVREPPLSNI